MSRWLKFLLNKQFRFAALNSRGLLRFLPDDKVVKLAWKLKFGREIDLDNPKTFNEKLQWLKLNDRKPMYTQMVDKYAAKQYIQKRIGEEYIIPTLGVWDSFDEIDFDKLPDQFVLKCTHDSGGVVICKDKSSFDIKAAKRFLNAYLKRDYYVISREWPYKNVKHQIIAEKYMVDQSGELRDYKFMCFNGVHKCTFTCTERFSGSGLKVTFFDKEWNVLPFERDHPKSHVEIPKPRNYEKMIELAEIIAKDLVFARIDFYEVQDRIYFGEITFYPGAGMEAFQPESWDYKMGEWLELPNKGKM